MNKEEFEVIEANQFVKKYGHDILHRIDFDYRSYLNKETLREHERQMRRLSRDWRGQRWP